MRQARYWVALAAIAAYPFIVPNEFFVHIAQEVAITAIAAIGLNILFGLSGQLSLGQAGFFALGAYGSGILALKAGWPLWATIPVGILVAGVAGVAVGLVALRTRTHYLAMATLAFGYMVEIVAQRWVELTGGSMGLVGLPQLDWGSFARGRVNFFWTAAIILLTVQTISDYVSESRVGRNLNAIRESETFALTVGIHASRWRAGVFVFSAVLAGISGALFAHQSGYVSSDAFGLERSLNLLIAVVIGGLGHRYGAVLGALVIVLLNQLTADLYQVSYFILGTVLLVVMVFSPKGLAGALDRLLARRRRAAPSAGAPGAADSTGLLPGRAVPPGAPDGPVLSLHDVTKSYAGVVALDKVSIDVMPGTVHALIGPNGAGKSTLINVISGIYRPDAGRIEFLGAEISRTPAHERAKRGLARTFQNLQLVGSLSIAQNIMLALPTKQTLVRGWLRWLRTDVDLAAERAQAMRLLDYFGIGHLAEQLPGDLSYGHRKLCELARAMARAPSVLLLDEPIAGLNEAESAEIARIIAQLKARGMTVILVEHNMSFVMGVSDCVTVLDYGRKIAEGRPAEIKRDAAVIGAYLGVESLA